MLPRPLDGVLQVQGDMTSSVILDNFHRLRGLPTATSACPGPSSTWCQSRLLKPDSNHATPLLKKNSRLPLAGLGPQDPLWGWEMGWGGGDDPSCLRFLSVGGISLHTSLKQPLALWTEALKDETDSGHQVRHGD